MLVMVVLADVVVAAITVECVSFCPSYNSSSRQNVLTRHF